MMGVFFTGVFLTGVFLMGVLVRLDVWDWALAFSVGFNALPREDLCGDIARRLSGTGKIN